MAFTKKHKTKMMAQYEQWLEESKAVFFLEYKNMSMKEIDTFRAKVREAGAEAHVVKNTLMTKVFKDMGYELEGELEGTNLAGFAFQDAPSLAKVLKEATKKSEVFSIRGGFLDKKQISEAEISALAELPPLPVMRATILGTILAPASKLVRTINEPARGLAAVIKAYSEKAEAAA